MILLFTLMGALGGLVSARLYKVRAPLQTMKTCAGDSGSISLSLPSRERHMCVGETHVCWRGRLPLLSAAQALNIFPS
eukprot:1307514-Pleurochrysis_carterae.AAC.1